MTKLNPIRSQCTLSLPPESIRKPFLLALKRKIRNLIKCFRFCTDLQFLLKGGKIFPTFYPFILCETQTTILFYLFCLRPLFVPLFLFFSISVFLCLYIRVYIIPITKETFITFIFPNSFLFFHHIFTWYPKDLIY